MFSAALKAAPLTFSSYLEPMLEREAEALAWAEQDQQPLKGPQSLL